MTKQKRWTKILEECKTQDSISVNELVNLLNVSPATVRRDLQEMEDLKMISRYHGGAKVDESQYVEPSMIIKSESNSEKKKRIAIEAARHIHDNQMIYIDAGTSTYEMIKYINAKNITIVTPGIPHISLLSEKGINTIVLGGIVRWSTQAITGKQALKQLEEYYFDACFIGTNAVHDRIGFTTSNEMEASTKQLAISRSKTAYILADSSKFNKLCPVKFAQLSDAIIISDEIHSFDLSLIKYITTN